MISSLIDILRNIPIIGYLFLAYLLYSYINKGKEKKKPNQRHDKPQENSIDVISNEPNELETSESVIEDFDESDFIHVTENTVKEVYLHAKNDLNKMNRQRQKTLLQRRLMWITFILIPILSIHFVLPAYDIYTTSNTINILGTIAMYTLMFSTCIFRSRYISSLTRTSTMERNIIERIVKKLFPSFNYSNQYHVTNEQIRDSKLFETVGFPPSTYGYLNGRYRGVNLHISDIGLIEQGASKTVLHALLFAIPVLYNVFMVLRYVIPDIFSSHITSSTLFTFRGLFFWARFNKELKGTTIILPKSIEDKLKSIFNGKELVRLEDTRFNNEFLVYGDSQIEARYILTPSLMEKIMEFKQSHDCSIMLSFHNNMIYIAVENSNGLFAFPKGNIESERVIQELIDDILITLAVVDDFKLNKRTLYTETTT